MYMNHKLLFLLLGCMITLCTSCVSKDPLQSIKPFEKYVETKQARIKGLKDKITSSSKGDAKLSDKDIKSIKQLISKFLTQIKRAPYPTNAQLVAPYLHNSLLTADGATLDGDTMEYSFKKASQNAKLYKIPADLTRVQQLNTSGAGSSRGFDMGIEYKVWIAKKANEPGLAAPLVVIFPADGSPPKLTYIGSL